MSGYTLSKMTFFISKISIHVQLKLSLTSFSPGFDGLLVAGPIPQITNREGDFLQSREGEYLYIYPEAHMLISVVTSTSFSTFSEWGKSWADPEIWRAIFKKEKKLHFLYGCSTMYCFYLTVSSSVFLTLRCQERGTSTYTYIYMSIIMPLNFNSPTLMKHPNESQHGHC